MSGAESNINKSPKSTTTAGSGSDKSDCDSCCRDLAVVDETLLNVCFRKSFYKTELIVRTTRSAMCSSYYVYVAISILILHRVYVSAQILSYIRLFCIYSCSNARLMLITI